MTDTEPTIYPHDITDLSQVRWYVQGEAPDLWIVGDATTKGQRAKAFVLHVARADCHGDGGDSSAWLAEQVAVKLSETDNGWRASWQSAVDEVNRTRTRMRVIDAAATNLLALWRDPSVCSPGMGFDIALGELARAAEGRQP